jgi:DNA-binding transcriptional ArsR family regulator
MAPASRNLVARVETASAPDARCAPRRLARFATLLAVDPTKPDVVDSCRRGFRATVQLNTFPSEHFCKRSTVQLSRRHFTWPFQALADESRFRAVRLLASLGRPLTAGQLATGLACEPSHLSRHLNVLEATKLVEVRRKGRFHWVGLRGGGAYESLAAAVLSMPDSEGILADDIARLLAMPSPGGESDPYSVAGAADGAASAGGSASL